MPRPGRRPALRRRSATMLALALAVLVLGALAEAGAGGLSWWGIEGPGCAVAALGGESLCPGCGLGRSTALAIQGRLADAWGLHRAGPVLAASCVLGASAHAFVLLRGAGTAVTHSLLAAGRVALAGALVSAWIARLAGL